MWFLCLCSQSSFPCNRFFCRVLLLAFFTLLVFFRNQLVCLMAFSCSLADLIARLFSLALVFLVVASCPQSCHNIGRFFGGVVFPAWFNASAPTTFFSSVCFFRQPCGLTIRALDGWFCGDLLAFFWLRVFSALKHFAHHPPVTQTVGRFLSNMKSVKITA